MLNRQEFADHFNSFRNGLGDTDSPLWIPDESNPSQWFICVEPLGVLNVHGYDDYYEWCKQTLTGAVRCYCSDTVNREEWWGFTDKTDITIWALKWTHVNNH
jgi:hypothetical protein